MTAILEGVGQDSAASSMLSPIPRMAAASMRAEDDDPDSDAWR